MYVHIGKEVVVKEKDIVGIFDLESISKSNVSKNFLQYLKENEMITNNTEEKNKSLVITLQNNEIKGYLSNISSGTLQKRANKLD
jgi:hypothetical protein